MISKLFIERPIVAIVIAIITVIGGLVAMRGLPVAQFPEIIPPQILVSTTFTGADAVTIEQSVATPLEQQMNGVDDMLYMQSTNANDGTMTLTVTFDVETDPNIDQVNAHREALARHYFECFGPDFEQQTGCQVNVKIGNTSDEMVQLMRQGGYDGVSASGDATTRLIEGGDDFDWGRFKVMKNA